MPRNSEAKREAAKAHNKRYERRKRMKIQVANRLYKQRRPWYLKLAGFFGGQNG